MRNLERFRLAPIRVFAFSVVCLTVPLSGCLRPKALTRPVKPLTLVSAQRVTDRSEGDNMLRYSGNVTPYTRVNLAFKVNGYIESILQRRGADGRLRLLQPGDPVTRGTALAQVRQADYTVGVAQSQSQLEAQRANLAQSRSHYAQSVASRQQAQSALAGARSSHAAAESQLAEAEAAQAQAQAGLAEAQAGKRQAQASLSQAEASREQAKLAFARAENLFASQSLTKPEYDSAKAQDQVTQGQVEAAQQQISQLQAKEESARAQIQTAQAKIAGAKAQIATSQTQIEQARAQVRANQDAVQAAQRQIEASQAAVSGARAQVAQARIPVEDTVIKAPLDGVLLQRSVEIGTLVSPGSVGFVMADTRRVKVVFGVPDLEVRRVRPGMPLAITTESYPDLEFHGRVTAVSPSADTKSRVFDVEVTVPNGHDRLKVGMIATLELPGAAPSAPFVTVPVSAIVSSKRGSQNYAVYVVQERDGKPIARARDVKLGQALGNMVIVSAGVKNGERVITTGASLVVDGEPVRVLE